MRTRMIVLVVTSVCLLDLSSARADGWYFSEGFGGSEVESDLGEYFDGTMNVRVAVGRRTGRWALEGFIMGNMLEGTGDLRGGVNSATGYGVSARYLFPVADHFELYLRGGLHKMRLDADTGSFDDSAYSGRAIHYGAGAQLKGKVPVLGLLFSPLFFTNIGPKMTGALWLETSNQITRLHHANRRSMDGSIKSWTVGFAMGSDF